VNLRMKLGIMQPYLLPYIGYFQLIAAVDVFVVYDNIQYTKKGWINRNRLLQDGTDLMFSVPLKKGSDYLEVRERSLAETFDRRKLLNQFRENYRRAPFFASTWPLLEQIIGHADDNLFRYIHNSIVQLCAHLSLETQVRISSDINIDHTLRGQDKVIAINQALCASVYRNAIGGLDLYSREAFRDQGIEVQFIKSRPLEYAQFGKPFVPWLSIVDVLMFNSVETIKDDFLSQIELV
jgi:hypothetical protein